MTLDVPPFNATWQAAQCAGRVIRGKTDYGLVVFGDKRYNRAKQKEVLVRRFGLMNHHEQTLEQIGSEIGLTRERVRQIQVDGLRRLRDLLHQHDLSSDDLFEELFKH